eukprot:7391482-Prymnesium_polylepis.2
MTSALAQLTRLSLGRALPFGRHLGGQRRHLANKIYTASGVQSTFAVRLYQFFNSSNFLSEKLKMQLYPPFFLMGVRVLDISDQHGLRWGRVRMRLPLNFLSRNPGGVMFGGYIACLADPIAAIACSRNYRGFSCWTRAATIDFVEGGTTSLVFKFDFPQELDARIQRELAETGRSTPTFECGFFREGDPSEKLTVRITNTVAIRSKGYIKASSPAAADEFAAPAIIASAQEMLRRRILTTLEVENAHELTEERIDAVAARVLGGRPGTIGREEFDQMLDTLGVARLTQEGHQGSGADTKALEAREVLWSLIDVRQVGRISAKDFMEFWRNMDSK